MTAKKPRFHALFLGAGAQMQCGVGQFTRLLQDAVEAIEPGRSASLTLTASEGSLSEIWRAVGEAETIVCNFPIVAWKRVILKPLAAMTMAWLRRRRVVLIQHEWDGLHWLRRLTYLPALLLADTIIMFSPLVQRELADAPIVGWLARKSALAPLPPNIGAPAVVTDTELRRKLAAARAEGHLVIGHFGSIYPGKQPEAVLEIAAVLKQRGLKPLAVYIGSFIRALEDVEASFRRRVAQLDLSDDVIVTGFIASDAEVFGLFDEIDAFCYVLDEGVTARRSSILTVVQSGRPVIVTDAIAPDEFDHHLRFKALIDSGAIVRVPRGASYERYADAIVAAARQPSSPASFDYRGWWQDVARAVRARL
jgi:glycosyltransferase involved in cell wall biosynthesis